jgi:hypothetical protein
MMPEASAANIEMSIVLPLGVVAHQLMKIEAELRLLNMRALTAAGERGNGRLGGMIDERIDNINAVLDSIRSLMSNIEADVHPRPDNVDAARKPRPDRDD